MWARVCYGAVRIVLGLFVLKLVGVPFSDIFASIMNHSFVAEHGIFQLFLKPLITHGHQALPYYAAVYLLFWGVLDIVLSIQLLRNQMWAYPFSLILISCFMTYEIGRFLHRYEPMMLFLIALDIVTLWLIAREYRTVIEQKSIDN